MLDRYLFSSHRLEPSEESLRDAHVDFGHLVDRALVRVGKALNSNTMLGFVGNGLSRPLGYPSWGTAIDRMVARAVESDSRLFSQNSLQHGSLAHELGRAFENNHQSPSSETQHTDNGHTYSERSGEQKTVDKTFLAQVVQSLVQVRDPSPKTWKEYIEHAFSVEPEIAASEASITRLTDAWRLLSLKRIVTTNYDSVLEDILINPTVPASDISSYSFTWKEANCRRLAAFSIPQRGDKHVSEIFHCHGRIVRTDAQTTQVCECIVTERDYRQLYLGDQKGTNAYFRQVFDVILGSSPIIFMGYGLADRDLMRYLRIANAHSGTARDQRQLFVLREITLPEGEALPSSIEEYRSLVGAVDKWEVQTLLRFGALAERYGLHVLPCFIEPRPPREEPGPDLMSSDSTRWADGQANQLELLAKVRQWWARSWVLKPCFRGINLKCRLLTGSGRIPTYGHGLVTTDDSDGLILNQSAYEGLRARVLAAAQYARKEVPEHGDTVAPVQPEASATLVSEESHLLLHEAEDADGERKKRVFCLVGPGGSGKSWLATAILRAFEKRPTPFEGCFHWSAYYADDHITGIERAIEFLQFLKDHRDGSAVEAGHDDVSEDHSAKATAYEVPRHERLLDLMNSVNALMVFDGLERILKPVPRPYRSGERPQPVGRLGGQQAVAQSAASAHPGPWGELQDIDLGVDATGEGQEFLRVLARQNGCVVILTSRLFPEALWNAGRIHLPDILRGPLLDELDRWVGGLGGEWGNDVGALWRRLYYLVSGHTYALDLVRRLCRSDDTDRAPRRVLEDLSEKLQNKAPGQRVNEVIKAVLAVDKLGMLRDLTVRLSLFMKPFTEDIVELCWGDIVESQAKNLEGLNLPSPGDLLKQMEQLGLVFVSTTTPSETQSRRQWSMHPMVRTYAFVKLHGADEGELPSFSLAGFTSATARVHPGAGVGGATVKRLLGKLITDAERRLEEGPKTGEQMWRLNHTCRAMLSIVRGRMEANTVPVWTNYQDYIRMELRILDLARQCAMLAASGEQPAHMEDHEDVRAPVPGLWAYPTERAARSGTNDSHQDEPGIRGGQPGSDRYPYYKDELAWLYNDLALALLEEGSMRDAHAICEQGFQINSLVAAGDRGSQYLVQANLHLAHIRLEMGMLDSADNYLDETERANALLGWSDYQGRILGYRALVLHLRNKLEESDPMFKKACKILRQARNQRAFAVFCRYRGDLNLARGAQYREKGGKLVRESHSIARAHGFLDLEAYADNSLGRYFRECSKPGKAQQRYDAALRLARSRGIRRLEADVLSEQARLAILGGDFESAIRRSSEALRIANQLGLGLRQTSGLVVLGKANVRAAKAGHPPSLRTMGIAYLHEAQRQARAQHYWIRYAEATRELERLDEAGEPSFEVNGEKRRQGRVTDVDEVSLTSSTTLNTEIL